MPDTDYQSHIIYRCVVGSRAYGLDNSDSDTDRRGMYLPPADLHWSLAGVPDQLTGQATDDVYWEAQKFLGLILKANPNVLECLYTTIIEHVTPLAQELLDLRPRLMSKLAYDTYGGYAKGHFKKLQAEHVRTGEVSWKDFMHLLRFLLAGVTLLEEGCIRLLVGEHRDRLLQVKMGEMPFEECNAWRLQLHQRLDLAVEKTALPERPDSAVANEWLIRARRSMV